MCVSKVFESLKRQSLLVVQLGLPTWVTHTGCRPGIEEEGTANRIASCGFGLRDARKVEDLGLGEC